MNILEYKEQLKGHYCRWCAARGRDIPFDNLTVEYFPHDAGYQVDGLQAKQWLYVECPACGYEWSFKKLHIRDTETLSDEDIRVIFTEIASGNKKHGAFLKFFSESIIRADPGNYALLKPAAIKLIEKYELYDYINAAKT